MINKRLKDVLFTDQWSEVCMERLSPFGYVLVSHVLFIYFVNAHAWLLNEVPNGLLKICACCIITDEISASCCSG